MNIEKNLKIGIIGLGYVGLPLAVEFAKKFPVIGFDINQKRVQELEDGVDNTLEVDNKLLKQIIIRKFKDLQSNNGLLVTSDPINLNSCNFYIITVPTPVDKNKKPILTPLIKASETVGALLKKGIMLYMKVLYIQVQLKKIVYLF